MPKRIAMLLGCLMFPLLAGATAFSLTDTQGRVHTLDGYRGKWVLVNLWATWCPPCIAEMPELEALSNARRGELVVLGLAVDGQDARRVAQFAEKLHVSYPVIAGDAKAAEPFKLKGVPTSILYDQSGKQVLVKEGPVTRGDIESILNRRSGN